MSRRRQQGVSTTHYSTERHLYLQQNIVYTIKGILEMSYQLHHPGCVCISYSYHNTTTEGIPHSPYTESAKCA